MLLLMLLLMLPTLLLALLSVDGSHPGSLCSCTAESLHYSAATLHPSCSPCSSSCSSCSSIFTHAPPHAPCTPPHTLIPLTPWLYSQFHAAKSGRWCAHPDIQRKTLTASITTWTILLHTGLSTREAVTVGT